MPRGDGTGPFRLRLRGARTSPMGSVGTGGKKLAGRGLLGLSVPLIGGLIHDLSDPNGFLRPFIRRITGSLETRNVETKKIIDVDYKVIENKQKDT
ncbi:MAG: hypothetical protein U9P49_01925 [Thermodesulfobacteriota bacterium]|nr:hypothetical protein [Thermodesulfobacteriota bacterium]